MITFDFYTPEEKLPKHDETIEIGRASCRERV